MTVPTGFPDWPQRLLALQRAVHWAAGGRYSVAFRDSEAGGRLREAGQPWVTLALESITAETEDSIAYETLPDGSRSEVYGGQRMFTVELRAFSRSQHVAESAWYLLDAIRTRLRRSTYALDTWLGPAGVGIVRLRQVVNLSPRVWDARSECEAVLEAELAAWVCDSSSANSGEWIESVLLAGTFQDHPALDFTDSPAVANPVTWNGFDVTWNGNPVTW